MTERGEALSQPELVNSPLEVAQRAMNRISDAFGLDEEIHDKLINSLPPEGSVEYLQTLFEDGVLRPKDFSKVDEDDRYITQEDIFSAVKGAVYAFHEDRDLLFQNGKLADTKPKPNSPNQDKTRRLAAIGRLHKLVKYGVIFSEEEFGITRDEFMNYRYRLGRQSKD